MDQVELEGASTSNVSFKHTLHSRSLALNVLVVFSVLLNVYLVWRVRGLDQSIIKLKGETSLSLNTQVPVIDAFDPDGRPVQITFTQSDTPTILYVLTPTCKWCARNTQNINALAGATKGKFRVFGISLSSDNLKGYLAQEGLDFPVYADVAPAVRSALRLGGTPQTILVSKDGRVLKNWMGAYTPVLQREIEDYFRVSLPGITELRGT